MPIKYGKVTLLADNQVPEWTATSEESGFEASHLTDGNETTLWKATDASGQTLTYDQGTAKISEFPTSDFDASALSIQGISVAPNGTLWACDTATNKIYNIEMDGTPISSFLTSVFDASATDIRGISIALDGTLWVCDNNTDKIYNIETDGTPISSFLTSVFDEDATDIRSIVQERNGTLWASDANTDKIYNTETDGTWISEFETLEFDEFAIVPAGISYASDDTLWISDTATDKIYNVKKDGTPISEFATSVFDASATIPTGISYDPDGTLWVCDNNTNKVYNTKILLAFDSLFITGHNLNSINGIVKWQYSDDGAAWTTMEYEFTPVDDKSIGIRLAATRTTRAVRIDLSSMTAAAQISIAIVTRKQEIDFADIYDPHRVVKNRRVNRTLHGQTSDITEYFDEHILEFQFSTVAESIYQVVKDYFDNNPNDIIGVYWEPDFHPHQLWAMELDQDEINAPYVITGIKRDVPLRLRGLVE